MLNDHFSAFDLFKRKYTVILIDTGHFELKKKKNMLILIIINLKWPLT